MVAGCSYHENVGILNENEANPNKKYTVSNKNLYLGVFTGPGAWIFHGYNLYVPDENGGYKLCEKKDPPILLPVEETCTENDSMEEVLKKFKG